ncbi:MAG: hypothetical protein ACR2H3_00015 [Acidimicrobiales bacterium]
MSDPEGAEELVPAQIHCIDCGGDAFLLTRMDDEYVPQPGDIISYRCRDCLDQWYLEIPGGEDG